MSSSVLTLCPLFLFSSVSPLSSSPHPFFLLMHLLIHPSLFFLFASAVITTHSFNPLPLQSSEVEVMGGFLPKTVCPVPPLREQTILVFSFPLSHLSFHDQWCPQLHVSQCLIGRRFSRMLGNCSPSRM